MTGTDRCVAIIPARGGSKGIPGKNRREVGGIPLVARSVRAARSARSVDLVVVSTDDPEIAAIAEREGARVVVRPDHLAGDTASSESAVLHALDELAAAGEDLGVCLLIQCTSPFIAADDIDGTVALVVDGGCDCAFTATESHGFLWRPGAEGAEGVNHDPSVRQRRQDRPPELLETGAVYAMRVPGFRQAGHRFFGRIGTQVVPRWRSVEIDEPVDLELVRAMVEADPSAASVAPVAPVAPVAAPPSPADALPRHLAAIVFDFDGVMTDNRAIALQDGTEGIVVHRGDGAGIELLRDAGMPMIVITRESNPVALRRCEKLRLECVHDTRDKWPVLEAWLASRAIDAGDVVYVGNDHHDVECLERVGCGVVVADAHPSARAVADLVLSAPGGHGAVRELADLVLAARPVVAPVDGAVRP